MDIVTHILTAGVTANFAEKNLDIPKWPIYLFGIIPDIGELLIQKALNKKHNAVFGVYDLRTSDEGIASNLNVTWVYDFMHSFLVLSFIFLIYFLFENKYILSIGLGLLVHFLLDFWNHGETWALKLFFPFSNKRYPILVDTFGNWWEWCPQISFPFVSFSMPVYNCLVWLILFMVYWVSK